MRGFMPFLLHVSGIRLLALAATLAAPSAVRPQDGPAPSPSTPGFEVASVKPQQWTGTGSVGVFVRGNTLDAEHVSLFSLVAFAYNLRDVQLSGGPPWVRSGVLGYSELYQVIAKAPEGPPPAMAVFRQMLQRLLAERFKLQVRHVEKELPTYDLVVGKGGPRLTQSRADEKFDFVSSAIGRFGIRIAATHMTVQQLIDHQLVAYNDRLIFDKTGLADPYDFTLQFTVENVSADQASSAKQADAIDLPPLSTALQEQLGLKLEPRRALFDTVVIEHAERPTAN